MLILFIFKCYLEVFSLVASSWIFLRIWIKLREVKGYPENNFWLKEWQPSVYIKGSEVQIDLYVIKNINIFFIILSNLILCTAFVE